MHIREWSKHYKNGKLKLVEINNDNGFKVVLINYGAGIHRIYMNDKPMNISPLHVTGYFDCSPMYGKTIGRYAGRIENGRFKLNGKTIQLDQNNGTNCLHGGKDCIGDKFFDVEIIQGIDYVQVVYTLHDEENLFPGNVDFKVVYSVNNSSTLYIDYYATSDKDTILNMTNHTYFNLNGDTHKTCLNHTLKINASKYTKLKENMCLSKIEDVNKVMDFRNKHLISDFYNDESIQNHPTKGYDHCYLLDEHSINDCVAELSCEDSAYTMKVYTTYPCVVLYSYNYPDKEYIYPSIKPKKMHGICLECQYMPNSINKCKETVLKANKEYHHEIIFSFEREEI